MAYTIVLIIGLGLIFWAVIKFRQTLSMVRTGQRATATVIRMERKKDSEDGPTYAPVFEYMTLTQGRQELAYNVSSNPPSWEVGDNTTIIYDIDDPKKALVATYFGLFGLPMVLLAVAMPFLVIGGGYFLVTRFFMPSI